MENYMNGLIHGSSNVRSALVELKRRFAPVSLVEAVNLNSSLPDAFRDATEDVSSASLRVSNAKNTMENEITTTMTKASAAVSDILKITKDALIRR
jgi:phage-related minor tail protein